MLKCKDMPYHVGITLRIRPDQRQQHIIAINDGVRRAIYNRLVALERERYLLSSVGLFCKPVADRLDYVNTVLSSKTEFKKTVPWVTEPEVDSCAFDYSWRNHATAWANYRRDHSLGIPTFQKKTYTLSYNTNAHYSKESSSWDDGNVKFLYFSNETVPHHISLPILGCVKFQCSKKMRDLLLSHKKDTRIGRIKVYRDNCGDYFVALQLSSMTPFYDKLPKTGCIVAIDLNLTNLYTDSNGEVIDNPKYAKGIKGKLAKAQRKLSHKRECAKRAGRRLRQSSNYQKQRIKVAKLHRQTARAREDYLNVKAKDLVKSHDLIASEDLKVSSLVKNHSLAFAIADVSWGRFMLLIEAKAAMYGKTYLKVPPHYTTQICSACGHIMQGEEHIPLGVEEWVCPACGAFHKRDHNAAKNILARALAR